MPATPPIDSYPVRNQHPPQFLLFYSPVGASSILAMGIMKLIQVTWIDAVGADGWVTIEDLKKETPTIHNSVGYLINNTKDFVTICMSYDGKKENMGAWLCIPKKFITKTKKL